MGNLGNRLKRELIRSPVKAAVLGLVCLIAVWYWAPLLKGWVTGGSETPPDIVVKPTETEGPGSKPTALAKKNVKKTSSSVSSWQMLAKWLAEDPRAKPAVLQMGHRDPFRPAGLPTPEELLQREQEERERKEEKERAEREAALAELELDFSDLKLVLGGTVVGKRFRSATINGNTYLIRNDAANPDGRTIRIGLGKGSDTDGESTGPVVTLQLVEVKPYYVVLRHRGEEHRLPLDRPSLGNGNHILPQTSAN